MSARFSACLAGDGLGWALHGTLQGRNQTRTLLAHLGRADADDLLLARDLGHRLGLAAFMGLLQLPNGDNSRNNWLFALATNGEGWHNNHHADPRSAAHGHRWWELDVTYLTLRLLERAGLIWDVITPCRANSSASTSGTTTLLRAHPRTVWGRDTPGTVSFRSADSAKSHTIVDRSRLGSEPCVELAATCCRPPVLAFRSLRRAEPVS